jgi:Glycosyltransferases involved in cell wall biogenesis
MPAVSVIVPVYNAEKFLQACVDSVRAQTFTDWELLLIDDGSRDGSPALCDACAVEDDRIRVFHQENGGVSTARNLGLSAAQGTCIAFLDADDRYDPRFLSTLWSEMERTGADAAACAHWNIWPDGEKQSERTLPAGEYRGEELQRRVVAPLLGERLRQPVFNGFMWRYLYRTELIRENQVAFAGAYLEDELFLLAYFSCAHSLAVTEEPLYFYYCNPASATHRYMPGFLGTFRAYLERKEALARKYGLEGLCPGWRENTAWSGLLIAVGNEFAPGSTKSVQERQRAVQELCGLPEFSRAISTLTPEGLGRNKQIVADLVRGRHYFLLTQMYRLKNHL